MERGSYYYEVYKREEVVEPATLYERLCLKITPSFQVPIPSWLHDSLAPLLRDATLISEPIEVVSLALYSFLSMVVFSLLLVYFLPPSDLVSLAAIAFPLLALAVVFGYPLLRARLVRMKTIGESPLAILYLVISLRVSPSLESAMAFAAKNVPDPIGREFKLLMWQVELRKQLSMEEALLDYGKRVKPWAPGFSDALYLIANSVNEPTDALRINNLEKAMSISLDTTKNLMEEFGRGLSMPVAITNALGIMLPILGLILAPMASIFATKGSNLGLSLLVVYDLLLPLVMVGLIFFILSSRPGSFSYIDVENHPGLARRGYFKLKHAGREFELPIFLTSVAIFLALSSITLFYIFASEGRVLLPTPNRDVGESALSTLPFVMGLGLAAGFYFYAEAGNRVELRKAVLELEREFTSSLFQLSNILDQGKPIEQAFEILAKELKGTKSAEFFDDTIYKVRHLGLPLRDAIFHPEHGSIREFPSSLVKNILAVILESAESGPKTASAITLSISNYVKNLNIVQQKVEESLSDSVAALKFQSFLLVPLVSGVVVGLTQLVSNILLKMAQQAQNIFAGSPGGYLGGFGELLNIESLMQASFMQLVVGFYTVVLLGCMGYMIGGLLHGSSDRIGIYMNVGRILIIATLAYAVVTAVIVLVFGNLGLGMM